MLEHLLGSNPSHTRSGNPNDRTDTRLSTPPLNTSSNNVAVSTGDRVDSTRRAFLSLAAAVTVGGAALGVAIPMPGSAVGAGQAPEAVERLYEGQC